MARELNRDLFQRPNPMGEIPETRESRQVGVEEVRSLHMNVEGFSRRMKELESRVEKLQARVDDTLKQNRQRFERIQGHFQSQTEMIQRGFADINNKIAAVVSRVNERRISEGVVKEMVDRHSQAVQTFEVRLQQMQKLVSEQELQLLNARAELKDALHELARLKRL